jgi:hypothetical protein
MATSNMGLTLPDVSVTPGPTWASQINSDLTLIDQHNHTTGLGAPIPAAALVIDEELKFNLTTPNGLPATGLSYLGLLSPQSPPVATSVYSDAAGDLYYNNAAGTPVQITSGGSVAGTPASIPGMTPESSASFNGGTGSFIWQKNSGLSQGATMDSGPLRVRDGSSGANAITITPPSGLASAYTLTLPPDAPASQRILTANAGVSTLATVDSTLTLTSSLLKVANLGIDTPQLKNGCVSTDKLGPLAVTTAKIADGNVTQIKWGAKSFVYSPAVVADSTSSTVPVQISNMAVSAILRAGYSVRVELAPSLSGYSFIGMSTASAAPATAFFDGEVVAPGPSTLNYGVLRLSIGNGTRVPVSSFSFIYLPTQSGLHTFSVYWQVPTGAESVTIANAKLVVFEQ